MRRYDIDDWDDDDYCVHCECLACEYGPRDGQLMSAYPPPPAPVELEYVRPVTPHLLGARQARRWAEHTMAAIRQRRVARSK